MRTSDWPNPTHGRKGKTPRSGVYPQPIQGSRGRQLHNVVVTAGCHFCVCGEGQFLREGAAPKELLEQPWILKQPPRINPLAPPKLLNDRHLHSCVVITRPKRDMHSNRAAGTGSTPQLSASGDSLGVRSYGCAGLPSSQQAGST